MPRRNDLQRTEHPGIFKTKGGHLVRTRARDPRTGLEVQRTQLVPGNIKAALRVQAEMRAETRSRGETPRTRLEDYAVSWLDRKRAGLSVATVERYGKSLEQIVPTLGKFYVDAIRADDCIAWRDECAKRQYDHEWTDEATGEKRAEKRTYHPRTVNGWLRVLKTMLADACAELRLPISPADRVARLAEPETYTDDDPNLLTPEQLGALLVALPDASPSFWPLLCTMGMTAMRASEATALKRSDYDRDARLIEVRRSHVRGDVRDRTKTGKVRRVPVSPMLAEVLDAHLARLDDEARELSRRHGEIVQPSEWMFPSDKGTPRYGTTLAKPLRKALKLAGITQRLTPHGLRRTVNDALRLVASAEVQKAITGHSTERMREHYSHVRPEERAAAIAKVAEVIRLQRPR